MYSIYSICKESVREERINVHCCVKTFTATAIGILIIALQYMYAIIFYTLETISLFHVAYFAYRGRLIDVSRSIVLFLFTKQILKTVL